MFVGTVPQGDRYHASFFHHTAWGVASLVATAPRLKITRLWDSGDTLFSLARMGRYPRVIRKLISLVARIDRRFPWLAPRRAKWPESAKARDRLYRAGSICFVIRKRAMDDAR